MSEVILSERLQSSISDKNLAKFESILAEDSNLIVRLKPRIINDILVQCIKISTSSNENSDVDGIEFIEAFMLKFHLLKCYFVFSDDTCKSVVQLYIERNRQFSPHSVNFLLRCHDLELVKRVFEQNLVSDKCSGDCANWHLMFVASYQERFFTHYFDTIFEGFLARFIMICKLRCSLTQKRFFLTWFAGSLHLYTDEWFLQNEETRFKFVLVKLFESLILNGLLTNSDFVNLSHMLAKRNKELISTKQYSKVGMFQSSNDERKPTNDGGQISQELPSQTAVLGQKPTATLPISYFPILEGLFPLSLKNNCRLAIKRAMVKYNKNEIDKLPLPANLKRFVYFENECESIYKCFDLINNKK